MIAVQLRDAAPNIPCTPGWCLNYVQRGYRAGWAGASATDGWIRCRFRHANANFPSGVSVPVWFALADNPDGHVAIRMSDGSYYSSSHPTNTTPVHHPNLQHLLNYYTPKGAAASRLSLRGWSEDIGDLKVIEMKEDQVSAVITTEALVAVSMATTGRMPANATETQYAGKEATQANLDGFVTQWAAKSRVPALEQRIQQLEKLIADQGFEPLGKEVFVPKGKG